MGKTKTMLDDYQDDEMLDDEIYFAQYKAGLEGDWEAKVNKLIDEIEVTPYVFVYGTLMNGFGNNLLLEGTKMYSESITLEKYCMYAAHIPFVLESQKTSHIRGELYKIDANILHGLDQLEGHPTFYQRKIVETLTKDSEIVKAWLYFYNDENMEETDYIQRCEDGNYRNYRNQIQ